MPPRKKKAAGPTPVEAITHADKRANLPTADNQDFVNEEVERKVELRYPRDPSLDPQLVWRGKDALDGEDLVVDVPPIFIQEKIDPRVLIENLRNTASRPEDEPELTLFDDFDGLGELDQIEYYQHAANWSNRMILGDSLQVMASLAEREKLRGLVQMVYIDPPYGIKFGSNWQVSTRKKDVKDGKIEDIPREVEAIRAFRDTWHDGIHTYLTYLRDRMMAARDLLTESGSCFVQIGDENVHLVRQLMDEVFGKENFSAQIVFKTSGGLGSSGLRTVSDNVIWYFKDKKQAKFRRLFIPGVDPNANLCEMDDGSILTRNQFRKLGHSEESVRWFASADLVSSGLTVSCVFPIEFDGRTFEPGRDRSWKTNREGVERLRLARRLIATGSTLRYRVYDDDYPATELTAVWMDTVGELNKQYVVQTSTRIVERCLLMTTDPGDLVLDPTCGSGTTAFVAEQWGRRWVTVDSSRVALAIARQRLMAAKFPYYLLLDTDAGRQAEVNRFGTQLASTEVSGEIRYGFVYERIPHVTLRSIAQNPDISPEMSSADIEEAVRRNADQEMLVDRPLVDSGMIRVAGPFSVESLSPHRSISRLNQMDIDGDDGSTGDDSDFVRMILDNLRRSGIQNGRKDERIEFDVVDPLAGAYIHAVGSRGAGDGVRRIAISIGPRYGTVGSTFVKEAAREANKVKDEPFDLLCVLSYAFDPLVIEANDEYTASPDEFAAVEGERRLGKVPVLLVRMNTDLEMGDELKKTGAGNLFMVFGEPDVDIEADGDELVVTLNGVDVYDPNSKQIRSNDTDQIALWMIDTNYNGESFFVRHCYFTGGQDPYKKLKTALKADIDKDAWESLYSTVSRPFPRPDTGRIAIKVINDYGDEVVKVFDV